MDKEQMKAEITKLIEKYNREKDKKYNEEATKKDFILPLFKILGWNVDDSNEVAPEDKVSRKRVDYAFKLDAIPKFYLEAKPLNENLEGHREQNGVITTFAQQAVNYAYYKGCIWATLTNFSEIKVYDAWTKDTSSGFRFAIRINDFVNGFEDGLYLLSREAFEQGLLDKKYSTKSRKKPITEQLLLDFTNFRAILSKDVYSLNKSKNLTEEELDEAIQRLFDRLIFIRNCEDRELEPYDLLSALRQWKENRKGTLIGKLRDLFSHFDETYNSKIFSKHLCDQVDISDNFLSRVLDGLYTTEDGSIQYDFSLIDADVLGNIYEQYLGHILKKTEKRTKLTESKAKRKEEGIYYTPNYIVDYIVRNTVGELTKNKKVDVSKIKVLDPACGSGSFLIKTFDVLNEYHSKKEGYNQTKLVDGATYKTKTNILRNNIFGVDLDKQAVDIAQLNLLLKVAEKKEKLPILQQNIKNGNSLIDDPVLAGDKAFKWNEEFAEIMNNGGFDVVVGNPPYFNIKSDDVLKNTSYYKNLAGGVVNAASIFLKKGIDLLKIDGYLGYIVPKSILIVDSWQPIRKILLNDVQITKIYDVSKAFGDVGLEQVIIVIKKSKPSRNLVSIFDGNKERNSIPQKFFQDRSVILTALDETKYKIIEKMDANSKPLANIADMPRGITVNSSNYKSSPSKDLTQVLGGTNIEKYLIKDGNKRKPNRYIEKDDKRIKQKSSVFTRNRIVYQNIASSVPKIVACLEQEGLPTDDTLNNLTVNDKSVDTQYVLGILNSRLATFYLRYAIINNSILTIHLDKPYIGKIPIKVSPIEKQQEIANLVDTITKLNNQLAKRGNKDTDKKQELVSQVNKTNAKIDVLVYKMYDITEEEKKVIEESLK